MLIHFTMFLGIYFMSLKIHNNQEMQELLSHVTDETQRGQFLFKFTIASKVQTGKKCL